MTCSSCGEKGTGGRPKPACARAATSVYSHYPYGHIHRVGGTGKHWPYGRLILGLQYTPMRFDLASNREFATQEWPCEPGPRTFKVHVRPPEGGVKANTGLMLVLHNWGGRFDEAHYLSWCADFAQRYNVVALSVNYLQSGEAEVSPGKPYDHGYLQAIDALRALWYVGEELDEAGIAFNRRRCFAMGVSGGGNVALMANKFAPHTFACSVDICGMPLLMEEVAFGTAESGLNAGYSTDPADPAYLSGDLREIRDPGHPGHLPILFRANPSHKLVIVHGLDDDMCLTPAKIELFRNMVRAGLRPDAHFLTDWHINGEDVTTTGHAVGRRDKVTHRFADAYLLESGRLALQTESPNDFERRHRVIYATANGRFVVDYSEGPPTVTFCEGRH